MAEEQLVQLLSPEGERVANPDYESSLSGDEIFSMYRDMVIVRRLSIESTSLQRQGQLALWAPVDGQEAAQIGPGRALHETDFTFPTYREHGIAWCRGVPPADMLRLFRATSNGGWDPQRYRHSVPTVVLGNQALHAVGYAMGVQRDGAEEAVLTFFGDGASSQGDVLESFVWAASFNAPIVFLCQNNQWAISEPSSLQFKIPLYHRAHGFGFPGVRVDGNDVLATYEVAKRALDAARVGGGPSLIEAFTYRMGAHTTSDDPTRYRVDAEVEVWKHRDPIERVKALLSREYKKKKAAFDAVDEEANTIALKLREDVLAMDAPDPIVMFDHAYAEPHPLIEAGRREMVELGVSKGA
ncbi:MAG TPA: thiamine pyrophosphate-dependent dehydrogenase E1 component subunit alpha [Acidimicrobiales bacterium]|nr:thiamine pyrophosphate-dependent dehydrogenase E1 component subunit alpha [Acidimicrobiales bacterium]